jgi:hypothetical protein
VKQEFDLGIGDTDIPVRRWGLHGAAIAFINLHQDEQTSITAARQVLDGQAQLLHFASEPERCLRFVCKGRPLLFDPNRMFSERGARLTLEHRNGDAPEQAVAEVVRFGRSVLDSLFEGGPQRVIAVHNTDEDYSVNSFLDGGSEVSGAAAVHVVPGEARHDFLLVTRREAWDFLVDRGFNVVLQAPNLPDDGSLSVYCADAGVDYINVEAHPDHLERQVAMLRLAMEAP